MKRVFGLIVILAFASACAANAQSRRVRRAEPTPEERAEKFETKDGAEGEAGNEARNEAGDKAQDTPPDEARDGGGGDDKPLAGKEVTVRAVIRSKPNPVYPHEARRYGVQGAVKLRLILGADGKIRDPVEVLEGLPYGITEQAIKAARRIEFEPARKDGRPVSQYVTVVYHFHLY
ncbi:MAG TPA: energy transducer TonB [Pyrinomonadaceae bacterium]|jgi:protein TonB|nr:energy transducer TonB [Pyrinomonadaceae bacterium]